MKRLFTGVILATLLSTTLVAAGNKTSSSIVLNPPAGFLAATAPRLGDTVSFTVGYPSTLDRYGVWVQVLCYQNGSLMFGMAKRPGDSFLLGGTSSPWLQGGGAATCHADLYYWSTNGQKWNQLAWTEFDAQG